MLAWKRHRAYLKYVLRHKYYVWKGCRIVGGISLWRAIVHDWDKFLPSEWRPYAETFYAPDGSSRYHSTGAFANAWNQHQKKNRHHWQYWLITWDKGDTEPLPISEPDLREMVADWIGAGWAITGRPDPLPWYQKNREKIILHPTSREFLEQMLSWVDEAIALST